MDKHEMTAAKPRETAAWDPFREFRGLTGMSNLLEDLFLGTGRALTLTPPQAWVPRVDVQETDKEYLLTVSLPGMRKEDVKISVEDGVLTLSGERKTDKEEKGKGWVRREIAQGSFARSFVLPSDTHPEEIKAVYKDGLLTLSLRKAERAKNRGVSVKID